MDITNLSNKKLTEDEFNQMRQEALLMWPTGKEINFEEAVEFRKSLVSTKNGAKKLKQAKKEGKILLEPRGGVATVDEQIELLNFLLNSGNADLLPTTFDSYTRTQRFEEAQHGLDESFNRGKSMLNGLPVVNLGIQNCRKIVNKVDAPIVARSGVTDGRLAAEIVFASGFAGFQGSGISHNIAYTKDIPLNLTLKAWQYIDRLIALYDEAGVEIFREDYSPLTGTLIPPSISISISILDLIMAVEQGVKHFLQGYGQGGNVIQDVAALKVMPELGTYYLNKLGYDSKKVEIYTVFHQWMGAFPADRAQAFGVIAYAATVGALGGANVIITKSPEEAIGVPTKEANAEGLKATRQAIQMVDNQRIQSSKQLEVECEMIKKETMCILDKVLEFGEGDSVIGTLKAFKSGTLDVPWAPHVLNANKVLPARDNDGAIRFFETGNLPFTSEILEFNKEKLKLRSIQENAPLNYEMVINDVYAVSMGMLKGKFNT